MEKLSFINFKKRALHALIAVVFISSQALAAAVPFIPLESALASPTKITGKEHQGQKSDLTYTSGNITQYKEGDYINFRFKLEATHGPTSGQVEVRFTGDDSTCTFFDGTFTLGAITGTGPQPIVTTVGAPVAQNFGTSNGEWVQLLNINYPTTFDHVANETTVNYTLRLSQEAGECNGSSQHSRLNPAGGTVEQTGAQNVPVPANQIIELPEIFVEKWVDDNADGAVDRKATAGEWSFSLDGGTPVPTDSNGNVVFTNVTPDGNHIVTESAGPAGQSFLSGSGTNCTFQGSTATANVQSGTTAQDATCIFNNGVRPGSITIIKDAKPNRAQDFSFSTTGSGLPANFLLDDDSNATLPSQRSFNNLAAGTYTVNEAAVSGWDLKSLVCTGGTTQNNGSTVTITLAAGQNVTCTFTNVKRGTITVNKVTDPANDPTVFPISISGSGNIGGSSNGNLTTSQPVVFDVSEGSYSVSEQVPNGWSETGNTCTANNLTITVTDSSTDASLTKTCTITNTKLATLIFIKDALPNSLQDFSFLTTSLPGGNFMLDDDSGVEGSSNTLSNQKQFANLTPNIAYSLSEGTLPGWQLTGLTCDTGNYNVLGSSVTVTPTAGQTIICTFSNTKLGSISGTKFNVDADAIDGTAGTPLSGWTIFIDANNNGLLDGGELFDITDIDGGFSFLDMLPGTYNLEEIVQNGWTQIFEPSNVELEAGEESTGNDFGNFQNASINGFKWNDLNGNGALNDGESKLNGWTITLYNDNDDADSDLNNQVAQTVTANGGNYSFTNLTPGVYAVCETAQAGWIQTYPNNPNCHFIVINESGETNQANFGNQGRGTITVVKNVDTDNDGQVDQSNVSDWTWDINGSGNFATGSGNSQNVAAGDYTVSEDQKTDHHFVSVDCGNEQISQSESVSVTVSPGENVVCTFTNARDSGTITVNKELNPSNDPGKFNLQINGSTAGTGANVGDEGTTGAVSVVTGQYTVGETAGTDTDLADYSTSYVCLNGRTVVASGDAITSTAFTVGSGDNIVCTITNTRFAKIVVEKQTDPNGSLQSFDFDASYDGDGFSLSDGQQNNSGNLLPGTYSVSENTPLGWDLTSVVCSDQSDESAIELSAGEVVTCIFTNTEDANIVIVKQTNPDGSLQSFNFDASYDNDGFSLSDGQQNDSGDLDPGTYSVSENVPSGWDLESATCDDGSTPGNITLGAGETVTCTFTNEQDAQIIVVKETDPDGSSEVFDFTASYDNDGFSLSDGQQNDSGDLAPGIYSVSEVVPNGWQLENTACSDQSDSSAISLSAGETVTCTFTNEQDANIVVVKETLPNGDPQSFDFTASYDNDGFSLTDGASNNSGDLDPGTYSVSENVPEGWDLDSVVCSDQSNPASISLQAGETVTCTFTNIKQSEVVVTKYNDFDRDGEKDDNEPVLPGWEFTLEGGDGCDFVFTDVQASELDIPFPCEFLCSILPDLFDCYEYFEQQTTGEDGTTTFEGVKPDVDHDLSETLQTGWTLSDIDCGEERQPELIEARNHDDIATVSANPGETVNCLVGNYRDAVLELTKSNNRPEPTVNGDVVTYTLRATLPEDSGALFNTVVTDLPPENFSVVPGSETASSSFPGHNVMADLGGGPSYASPGNWTIGTMLPGEAVTLTYKAVITNSVTPGTYPDLAFASGCETDSGDCAEPEVYSNTHFAPDPFVGTAVSILTDEDEPGTRTVLVNTGDDRVLLYALIATVLMLAGFAVARVQVPAKGGRK